MRECAAEGCSEHAPGYDEFCDRHSPPDWVCEDCGCRERWDSAFCYLCGAGQPEEGAGPGGGTGTGTAQPTASADG